MVALVCWSRIAGGHRLRLRVSGVNHGSSCGVGHDSCKENPDLVKTLGLPRPEEARSAPPT